MYRAPPAVQPLRLKGLGDEKRAVRLAAVGAAVALSLKQYQSHWKRAEARTHSSVRSRSVKKRTKSSLKVKNGRESKKKIERSPYDATVKPAMGTLQQI